VDEPFSRLLTQSMVQGITYKNPVTGKYIAPQNVRDPDNPVDPETGDKLDVFYEKMSKSKYNGVDPKAVLAKYGADTARMFILFKAPPEKDLEWDDADVEGQFRFLNRVWRLVQEAGINPGQAGKNSTQLSKSEKDLRRAIHGAIAAITEDLEGDYQFNTAVSELMKLSNALSDATCKESPIYAEGVETLLKLLAPFAPHLAEELWHEIGYTDSIHKTVWPQHNPDALVVDEIFLVVQVMGKKRDVMQVPASATKTELEKFARDSEKVKPYLEAGDVKKVIVVPGKLVNFVVKPS
jgi:leucyl-tRNA synthetase